LVHVFEADSGREVLSDIKHPGYVTSVSFAADGRSIATGCQDGLARIFDLDCGRNQLKTIQPNCQNGVIQSFCLSFDGKKLATSTNDNIVRIFDVQTGREILKTTVHGHSIVSLCFSPGTRLL
jgi:WD40 repeat protein